MSSTTDYVGNIIYENAALKRILVDGGYYESGNYYFYITDHLGNNRIVTNAAASVVQSTQYYPFGSSFADASGASAQPYKYNGKELDSRNGLNMSDYGARWKYDWNFPTVDPLAEKYYSWSPYAYVMNNPLKYIDPTGESAEVSIDEKNRIITLTSNLILYGALATQELATSVAQGIQNVWNEAGGIVSIDGVEYSVSFVVNGTYNADITQADIDANTDIKNNHFSVVESSAQKSSHVDKIGGNTGVFHLSDLNNKTTAGHEYGHNLGLDEGPTNYLGMGQPSIMSQRGAAVDAPYTINPSLGVSRMNNNHHAMITGEAPAVLNPIDPNKRKVLQSDITNLRIQNLKFSNGKSQLGDLTRNIKKR